MHHTSFREGMVPQMNVRLKMGFAGRLQYMREFSVEVQFCLAHLIREVKFLIGLPHERTR